ncbi:protein BTG2 [Microplitis demolitor]|uniref:protein BTG2 n=1 Tax=Microplitis demolitor TaxID=69319 RepID=UPI00043FFF75|nr:protein BTG2 [Microplitis demolitor]
MRVEIVSATDFLVQLLRIRSDHMPEYHLSEHQLEMFKLSLTEVLRHHYTDHWFPDTPNRGSGYRCLRINGKMDPVIAQAGANVGLVPRLLRASFPRELTMWIDPSEVSYRIGENGSICVLYERSEPEPEEITPRPSSSSSLSSSSSSTYSSSSSASSSSGMSPSPTSSLGSISQQQQFESCKGSLMHEHSQFNEQFAAFVSS